MADHALVIGIDAYDDWANTGLSGAVRDALSFAGWLIDRGGVVPDNLHLVLGAGPASPPVPAALAASLRQKDARYKSVSGAMKYLKKSVPPGAGRVWFYYSGHGIMAFNEFDRDDGICCADFDPSNPSLSLTVESVAQFLRMIGCREQIMLIDACRDAPVNRNVRLGKFDQPELGKPPYPPQFIFKATSLGYEAAELDQRIGEEGGAFTAALMKGLGGDGSAKLRDASGGYIVRWSRLAAYVAADVAARKLVLPSGTVQEPSLDGDRTPLADPVLARFAGDAIAPVALDVSVAPPLASVSYELQAADLDDEPVVGPFVGGAATVMLPPAPYFVRARAAGFKLKSRLPPIEVYAPTRSALELVAASPPMAPPPAPPPQFEYFPSAPSTDVPDQADGAPAPPAAAVPATGRLVVRCRDPIVPLLVDALDGTNVASGHGELVAELPPGAYRVRALGPEGQANSELVGVDAGGSDNVIIEAPFAPSVALDAAIRTIDSGVDNGTVLLAEAVGPAASVQLSTMATLAVGQALEIYGGRLGALQLGTSWNGATGVELVVIDDVVESRRPQAFRLWRQYERNDAGRQNTHQPGDLPQLAEAAVETPPGHYWLQLSDRDRQRQAGFKVACPVLPDCVTLVLVERDPAGVRLHLYAIRHAATSSVGAPRFPALRFAEAVQRARLAGRVTVADPAVAALVTGDWYEPFSAALTGFTLRRLIAAGANEHRPGLDRLAQRLTYDDARLVDGWLLLGVSREMAGDAAGARAAFATALELRAVPLVADGLEAALTAVREYRLHGEIARWLADKARQAIEHRAWTLRRES